jgi:hypothetical protein
MSDNRTKQLPTVVSILIVSCLGCCCLIVVSVRVHSEIGQMGVRRAADKVNVAPTIGGLAEYIVENIETGMTRSEVEQVLGTLAPVKVQRGPLTDGDLEYGPTPCDHIRLRLTLLPTHDWLMAACYDREGRLVLLQSTEADYPSLGIVNLD